MRKEILPASFAVRSPTCPLKRLNSSSRIRISWSLLAQSSQWTASTNRSDWRTRPDVLVFNRGTAMSLYWWYQGLNSASAGWAGCTAGAWKVGCAVVGWIFCVGVRKWGALQGGSCWKVIKWDIANLKHNTVCRYWQGLPIKLKINCNALHWQFSFTKIAMHLCFIWLYWWSWLLNKHKGTSNWLSSSDLGGTSWP